MFTGKTLHILNGDATRDVFKRTSLKEEHYLVWRETLCEGPVTGYLHDPAFWKRREEYICTHCHETPEGYFDKVIMEQIRLEAFLDDYTEIVLWFQHDLFCQVNLIALITLITQNDMRAKTISVVSIGSHPEMERFKGYGDLSPRQLEDLLPGKKELTKPDLQFARQVWEAYTGEDPRELEAVVSEAPVAFPFLAKAIELHLQRLPFTDNGLSLIDRKILEIIAFGSLTKYEVMRKLLQWDPGYGFTDLQFLNLVQRLKPFLYLNETVVLNNGGVHALEGKTDLVDLWPEPLQVGGTATNYRWDPQTRQTVKFQ